MYSLGLQPPNTVSSASAASKIPKVSVHCMCSVSLVVTGIILQYGFNRFGHSALNSFMDQWGNRILIIFIWCPHNLKHCQVELLQAVMFQYGFHWKTCQISKLERSDIAKLFTVPNSCMHNCIYLSLTCFHSMVQGIGLAYRQVFSAVVLGSLGAIQKKPRGGFQKRPITCLQR